MDCGESRPIEVRVDHSLICEEWRQGGSAGGQEGGLHAAGAGIGCHQPVRGVVGLQGVGQELGVEEFQLVRQGEGEGLIVDMADGGHFNGASADVECSILHGLKFCNSGGGGIGGPDWGGISKDGFN